MKLTIPAREVKNGDRLPDLGLTITSAGTYRPIRGEQPYVVLYLGGGKAGSIHVDPDATVTVERDDPDEALIERIAAAIGDGISINAGYWRQIARKALAAMRADS